MPNENLDTVESSELSIEERISSYEEQLGLSDEEESEESPVINEEESEETEYDETEEEKVDEEEEEEEEEEEPSVFDVSEDKSIVIDGETYTGKEVRDVLKFAYLQTQLEKRAQEEPLSLVFDLASNLAPGLALVDKDTGEEVTKDFLDSKKDPIKVISKEREQLDEEKSRYAIQRDYDEMLSVMDKRGIKLPPKNKPFTSDHPIKLAYTVWQSRKGAGEVVSFENCLNAIIGSRSKKLETKPKTKVQVQKKKPSMPKPPKEFDNMTREEKEAYYEQILT